MGHILFLIRKIINSDVTLLRTHVLRMSPYRRKETLDFEKCLSPVS